MVKGVLKYSFHLFLLPLSYFHKLSQLFILICGFFFSNCNIFIIENLTFSINLVDTPEYFLNN